MPAKVAENIRPTVIAGLAKLVEDVKKYAAPIYAPTAAGSARPRWRRVVGGRANITQVTRTLPEVGWLPVAGYPAG